jgi:ABC-type transport system involved in multi-copper enzyme maturation permease subunit
VILALLRRSFGRARGLLLPLAAVLTLFQILVVSAAAYVAQREGFSSLLALLPPFMQQAVGGVFSSFGAMVAFGYFHPVVITVFVGTAIVVASEPAADVEMGLVDLVLARPVRRAHLVTRSMLMVALTTATLAGLMVTASWLTMRSLVTEPQALAASVLLRLATNLVALAWAVGAAALAASCLMRRRAAAAGSVAIAALAVYVLNFLADLWPRLRPLASLSPFHYYRPLGIVSGEGTEWLGDVSLLAGIAAVFCGIAYVAFDRRDV